jgi:hypothetical protein
MKILKRVYDCASFKKNILEIRAMLMTYCDIQALQVGGKL